MVGANAQLKKYEQKTYQKEQARPNTESDIDEVSYVQNLTKTLAKKMEPRGINEPISYIKHIVWTSSFTVTLVPKAQQTPQTPEGNGEQRK